MLMDRCPALREAENRFWLAPHRTVPGRLRTACRWPRRRTIARWRTIAAIYLPHDEFWGSTDAEPIRAAVSGSISRAVKVTRDSPCRVPVAGRMPHGRGGGVLYLARLPAAERVQGNAGRRAS